MENNEGNGEPDDAEEPGSQPVGELTIEEKFRYLELKLDNLEHNQISARERLTLISLNSLLSVAGLVTILVGVATGVGLIEMDFAVEFLENTYLRFFGLVSLIVFLITVVTSGMDMIVSTYKLMAPWRSWKEDLPQRPDTSPTDKSQEE